MTVFLLVAIPAVIITALVFALKGLALLHSHVQARFGYKFFRAWHFLFLENCRKTNLLYGSAGTALEMAISPVLFSISLLCLPVLILAAFGFLTAKRVYVANRDW
jgi:hypothetical protein